MTDRGTIPAGPSEHYLRLLKGEITPEEYVKSVKRRVDARRSGDETARSERSAAARPKRA